MRKLTRVLISLVLVISTAIISTFSGYAEITELPADWDPTKYEYIVVGNEGLLGDYAWQPTNEAFKMKYDETAGMWYLNLDGIANEGASFDIFNSPLYRIVTLGYDEDNPMELSFTDIGVAQHDRDYSTVDFKSSSDMKAKTLAITFDGYKTYSEVDTRYEPSSEAVEPEHTYFAVGDKPLFNPAWTFDCPTYQLTKLNSGVYSVQIPATKEMWGKDVAYKVVQDGKSDVAYNDKGLAEGDDSNAIVHIPEDTAIIQITFLPDSQCAQAVCYLESELPAERLPQAPTDNSTEAPVDEATATPTDAPTSATNSATSVENATTTTMVATAATTFNPFNSNDINASSDDNGNTDDDYNNATMVVIATAVGVVVIVGAGVIIIKKKRAK